MDMTAGRRSAARRFADPGRFVLPGREALIPALAALFLALAAAFLLPSPGSGTAWRGYGMLLVEEAASEPEVLDILAAEGARGLVSESSQSVYIADWPRPRERSLAEVEALLLPGDPRRDEYLAGLSAWFRAESSSGKDWRILYAPGRDGAGMARLAAALVRRGLEAFAPEEGGRGRGLPDLAAALALVAGLCVLVRSRRGHRAFRAVILLPWAFFAPGGLGAAGFALLAASALAGASRALENPFDEFRSTGRLRDMGRYSLEALILAWPQLAGLAVLCVASPSLIPSGLLALGAGAAGLAVFKPAAGSRTTRPFVPVRMLLRRPRSAPAGEALLVAVALLAIAGGAATFLASTGRGRFSGSGSHAELSVPAPRALPAGSRASGRPGPREAAALVASRGGDQLVDLADWLAHRARQDAFDRVPLGEDRIDPFAPVLLPSLRGGEVEVLSFDEGWARETWAGLPRVGVEAIALAQGGFVRVERHPLGSLSGRPLAPGASILYIILLAPLIYGALPGLASGRRPGTRRTASGSVESRYEIP